MTNIINLTIFTICNIPHHCYTYNCLLYPWHTITFTTITIPFILCVTTSVIGTILNHALQRDVLSLYIFCVSLIPRRNEVMVFFYLVMY